MPLSGGVGVALLSYQVEFLTKSGDFIVPNACVDGSVLVDRCDVPLTELDTDFNL